MTVNRGKVLLDMFHLRAFGNDAVATTPAPCQCHLSRRAAFFCRDRKHVDVGEEMRRVTLDGHVRRVRVGKRRVCSDLDPECFMPIYPVGLWEVGVAFELMDRGLYGGVLNELAELSRREVGDTNVAYFVSHVHFLHPMPGLRGLVSLCVAGAGEGFTSI